MIFTIILIILLAPLDIHPAGLQFDLAHDLVDLLVPFVFVILSVISVFTLVIVHQDIVRQVAVPPRRNFTVRERILEWYIGILDNQGRSAG